MSEISEELLEMLDVVYKYSAYFGVKFSMDKSLLMTVNTDKVHEDREWSLGVNQMQRTEEFKYLGATLNVNECEKAKSDNLFRANQWYGRPTRIVRYRANKYVVVRELWKEIAVPSIMYGMNVLIGPRASCKS